MYKARTYRKWVKSEGLISFEVIEKETDLFISAIKNLEAQARESVLNYRKDLEDYIRRHPEFHSSLLPVEAKAGCPDIVRVMIDASMAAGVGPMASVAGAMAEFVGRDMLKFSGEVIVENGGDIFLKISRPRTMGIYAGDKSPFTGKLTLEIEPTELGLGVCTSSGTVSHSLSFGKADAVLMISENAALADAAATAAGNAVKTPKDMEKGIDIAKSIPGIIGVLILAGDRMGSWGKIKLI